MDILDLSCDVAGRFGTRLFLEAGDTVHRIGPDGTPEDPLWAYLDAGKRQASLGELPALLAQCDLVWTSFDQGRFLGAAENLAVPEDRVHVTTSSFGTTGPYASWRGGSMADWAAGGYLYITGDPDREPLSGPENFCAYAAGYTAAIGAEAALIDRLRTGRGRHLDISTMGAMLLLHQSTFSRTASGELRRRTGRYTEVYPLTVLPCRDGHVSIGVVTDAEFDKLSIVIDQPELPIDPRFTDRLLRWENRDALDEALATWLLRHDGDEVVARMQAGGLPCAKVAGAIEVTRNPQLAHRGFWREAPGGGLMPSDPLRGPHAFPGPGGPALGEPGRLPLEGLRVLDFTIFWAGPSATRTLADMGAEVIWVERPGARLAADLPEDAEASPEGVQFRLYDTKMFRGKRSIALNLERAEDRAVAHALAAEAHVVVENFRPGVTDKLGIGPRDLSAINPALTYVSLSGWGASGPWADWRSYGPSIEAASSIEARTGYAGGEPLRLGHTLPDGIGGLVGALAALRGVRQGLSGGTGRWYDIAQLEAYAAMSAEAIVSATRDGVELERIGNRSRKPGVAQGVFPCAGEDQWIALRLEGTEDFVRLAAAGGPASEAEIAAFTALRDKQELAAELQAAGLEAFAVLDAHDLIADAHLRQRGYFTQVPVGSRSYAMPGTPFVAVPPMAEATARAPLPGEHSDEIRREAGRLT